MPVLSHDRTLPPAITSLRLGSALKDCGALGVAAAFDKSTAEHLFVYDDSTIGHSDWTDEEPEFSSKCFVAVNPDAKTIALLPLDNRIMTGTAIIRGGICDCMLLTETNMCFIEFKTNVTSDNSLTVIQRAKEASDQLWHTFNVIQPRCAKLSIQIEKQRVVDFHIVFDKNLEITGANSSLMDLQSEFLEDRKYMLFFDNEKTF